ncbi:DEAD/DEAH box helicase family protein [Flavobacterium rakeshii]|uniref:DEAD/DEAH box helicase n=1 Tax=Flavobacterium rakeshii TaxID=1038845 RepID=UPI002E7BE4F4|nr:DEAD/DEAH box helicase family protein [Flavobacterium rakeshii]MEE1897975.1 DEAD/DEAH box helicase family protein [Flavobacterium rakeshii]
MELKPYQQDVIKDLESYLSYLQEYNSPAKAFNNYWKDKIGEYNPLTDKGMRPYKDNIPGAVHIAVKVPTAGGKTFIACNALYTINKYFNKVNANTVVWLVPWSNLLQQTYDNLSNPYHPYREKLNSLFGHKVEVYQKEQLLQGANFNPTSVTEQLNILVLNFSSLRVDKAKKDDRKIYQENGALESFRETVLDKDLVMEGTDETALINIIRSLNPVVVVDESHNAESELSVEMLQNLNPSLVLDLTATPKKNSNIVSFVSALKLKKENMVKLPVVVYNHHKKEEVINSALHLQRQLELHAKEEEKITGKYIRPIILFQAQSNIKGKNNTTFQKIKEQLIKLKIPEEQIKIKVSGLDELKGENLMARDCQVRYIITVNALKEGWDCPNAYILASLADKSSAVDVEQILGRVLRQPYVTKHVNTLLNMSYVLTASARFRETLDNIVKGLQEAGFSKDDYYAAEQPEPVLTPDEILQEDLFGDKTVNEVKSDDEFNVDVIEFDPEENTTLESYSHVNMENNAVKEITEKAVSEGKVFEEKINSTEVDSETVYLTELMGKSPKGYSIENKYKHITDSLVLPQFFIKEEGSYESVLFEELVDYEVPVSRNTLLKGFNLLKYDVDINFAEISADIYRVDYDESKGSATASKVTQRTKAILVDTILSKPKDKQIKEVSSLIVNKLGDMTPITQQDLIKYVSRVFDTLTNEQIRDIVDNDFIYVKAIRDKINSLAKEYAKEQFYKFLDANKIYVKENFKFSETISFLKESTPIAKSLYEREADMNNFEQDMIMDIAALDNIEFWHRNLSRGKGFAINGFDGNHYPDFILYTKKGSVILIETKGDDRDNDDSRQKNKLGKDWATKAGDNYKYFMVFQTKIVNECHNAKSVIEVLKLL